MRYTYLTGDHRSLTIGRLP